jgi:hypothetical protein
MKKILFIQDNQGYYKTCVLFETDCNIPLAPLETILNNYPGAGRMSLQFYKVKEKLEQLGFICNKIDNITSDIEFCGILKGATGNY